MALGVKVDKAEIIRNYISEKIKKKDYVDRIPSLNQLAGHFNVNVKTAKRAVCELERTGVLYSQKGKGTFVNQKSQQPAPFLFVGRENKEISGVIASVLASAVKLLDFDYYPYTFLLPRETSDMKFRLPGLENLAGILVESSLFKSLDIESIDVPVVQLHGLGNNHGFPSVIPDVEGGVIQILYYLKSLGHQKIAYFGPETTGRREGLENSKRNFFFERLDQLRMQTKPEWNPATYYRVESGYESAMKVLSRDDRPTAIACVNDEVALGILNACDELGIRVPQDLSVIGFDDRLPAVMRKPFLTTVKVDFKQIAIEGIRIMHQSIQDGNNTQTHDTRKVVETHLVIRDTTGRVPE